MRDMYDEHEHVAIFWDYENCTPPCNVPGYDVVNNIRQVAHEYGSVKLFKAYLELSEQSSSKSIGLRSELQSCGVSLTDCPHNGRKDVADKMMIVDMLTYAIDNPAPATIVLISGDRDFVYAVSVLRLRRYRVVVVAPYTAHASLKSQASAVLDWEGDIMRRTTMRSLAPETYQAPPDDSVYRSPRRPPLSLGGPLPQPTPKGNRRPSFRAAVPAPAAGPDGGNGPAAGAPPYGQHSRNTSAYTVDGSLRAGATNTTDRSVPSRALARQAAVRLSVEDCEDEETPEVRRRPIPDIVDVMEDIRERMSKSSAADEQLAMPATVGSTPLRTLPVTVPTTGDSKPCATWNLTERSVAVEPPSKTDGAPCTPSSPSVPAPHTAHQPPVFRTMGYEPPIPRPATVQPLERVPSEALPSAMQSSPLEASNESSTVSSVASTSQSASSTTDPSPTAAVCSPLPPLPFVIGADISPGNSLLQTSKGPPLSTPLKEAADLRADSQIEVIAAYSTPPNAGGTTPAMLPEVPTTPLIPDKFQHLVAVLEDLAKRGNESPLRTIVAVRLLEVSRKIYAQAGTASFKEYSVAAERAGLVTLGGVQGYAWISLKPEFRGQGGVPSAPKS